MMTLAACVTGFCLDLLFGDPVWRYHPVRLMGALIVKLEALLRKFLGTTKERLIFAGGILCVLVCGISTLIPILLLYGAGLLHPLVRYGMESGMCYLLLATKSLYKESQKVYVQLQKPDVCGARQAVSMIVGRDTEGLTPEGITKATVETVAENTSDGVVAPLLYMLLGGAPLGFFYKAINTMDSMIGYRNESYLYLGRIAARLDDIANYIPARISALLMILSAFLLRMDGKNAWRMFRRDRFKHASPNSAQTEAVCAGALQIQLAGNACYFGEVHEKEYIGDSLRPVVNEDIKKAGWLLYLTAGLTLLIFGGIRYLVFWL
ncbi:MAG: adenosylcobinamide-phosphate synthase CbiB [Lachnospiraceae bacterium]